MSYEINYLHFTLKFLIQFCVIFCSCFSDFQLFASILLQFLWIISYLHLNVNPIFQIFSLLVGPLKEWSEKCTLNIFKLMLLECPFFYSRYCHNSPDIVLEDSTSMCVLIHALFTFFYIHKKKVLDSRKFSTDGFRWIDMFWDVLNTIWPFLENVCLSVGLSVCLSVCRSVCLSVLFCGRRILRTNGQKLMKLNIQLHFCGT